MTRFDRAFWLGFCDGCAKMIPLSLAATAFAVVILLTSPGCMSDQQGLEMHNEIREQQATIDDLRREYEDDISQVVERLDRLEAATRPTEDGQ